METPYYGSRQMARHLRRVGYCVSRKRVRRLMRKIGLRPIYQQPRTSIRHPQHKVYPYLLRGLDINRANQVWCTDITYSAPRPGLNRGAYVWNTMRKEEHECLALCCNRA